MEEGKSHNTSFYHQRRGVCNECHPVFTSVITYLALHQPLGSLTQPQPVVNKFTPCPGSQSLGTCQLTHYSGEPSGALPSLSLDECTWAPPLAVVHPPF